MIYPFEHIIAPTSARIYQPEIRRSIIWIQPQVSLWEQRYYFIRLVFGGKNFRSIEVVAFIFFVLGLICDTWGTGMMLEFVGGMTFDIHGITGVIAIVLMFIHASWALIVLVKKDEKAILNFHKFSILVWFIWLIPYFSPMIFSMAV